MLSFSKIPTAAKHKDNKLNLKSVNRGKSNENKMRTVFSDNLFIVNEEVINQNQSLKAPRLIGTVRIKGEKEGYINLEQVQNATKSARGYILQKNPFNTLQPSVDY